MFKTITKLTMLAPVALAVTVFLVAPGLLTLAALLVSVTVTTGLFCTE